MIQFNIPYPGGPSYSTFRDTATSADGPTFLKTLSNYTVRVGSDVTFTCQVENITNYKVGADVERKQASIIISCGQGAPLPKTNVRCQNTKLLIQS